MIRYHMIYDICYDMVWYGLIWYDIWYDMINVLVWFDMIWLIWYDMIRYDMVWYDMIWYFSTAVGLTLGGSITVHSYTKPIHRTTQITTNL